MITTVEIKPLGVNRAWQGRRFKTPEYKKFETDCLYLLPKMKVPEGALWVKLFFSFSNKLQDIDGPSKLCLDILCKKYGFDDRMVYRLDIHKTIVVKGKEKWSFEIEEF